MLEALCAYIWAVSVRTTPTITGLEKKSTALPKFFNRGEIIANEDERVPRPTA